MDIKIVKDHISKNELEIIAKAEFGDIVKAVVDIEQEIMAIGGELHADEEALLMGECDSKRENLWGINLYPKINDESWIEFNSMINLKPQHNNRSRGVEDKEIQKRIVAVVQKLVVD